MCIGVRVALRLELLQLSYGLIFDVAVQFLTVSIKLLELIDRCGSPHTPIEQISAKFID